MSATTRKLAQEALDAMFPSLPLFMQMTPPHNGTPTSREAAHSVKPRVSKLRENGCVRDSGRKRETDSGRLAVVWEYASR